jgi:hypothetical protein
MMSFDNGEQFVPREKALDRITIQQGLTVLILLADKCDDKAAQSVLLLAKDALRKENGEERHG